VVKSDAVVEAEAERAVELASVVLVLEEAAPWYVDPATGAAEAGTDA
jgi:hypothetical protein